MPSDSLATRIRALVGDDGVIDHPDALGVYECDGYTLERATPELVVLPRTTAEVAAVVRLLWDERSRSCRAGRAPACPAARCRWRRRDDLHQPAEPHRAIDRPNRRVVAQAGVVNLAVERRARGDGLLYAPDPSSQAACTIGGNVATNSGGPHTLKYGVTVNHVLGVELVLPDGAGRDARRAGRGPAGLRPDRARRRLRGTFGIVTKASLRLTRNPEAVPHAARRLRHRSTRRARRSATSSAPASCRRRSR